MIDYMNQRKTRPQATRNPADQPAPERPPIFRYMTPEPLRSNKQDWIKAFYLYINGDYTIREALQRSVWLN